MTHDAYSTKRVTVWSQEREGKYGYAIKYQDGYISWCPENVFERDYNSTSGGELTFGQAIESLKSGRSVRRVGWNGKNMWLSLQRPTSESKMTAPYIYMKTADDKLVPWLASQTDMLSCDWEELS